MTIGNIRALSFIAAKLISKNDGNTLFDYSTSSYFKYSGNVSTDGIDVNDSYQKCYYTSDNSEYEFTIYCSITKNYIKLDVVGNEFSGYDFESEDKFSGSVIDQAVAFHDESNGNQYNYLLS